MKNLFLVMLVLVGGLIFVSVSGCGKGNYELNEKTIVSNDILRPQYVAAVEDIPETDLCKVIIATSSDRIPLVVSRRMKPQVGDIVDLVHVSFVSDDYGGNKKFLTIKTKK